MLSKCISLVLPVAASGLVLGGETVVPVKAAPTDQPARLASAGTGLTGSHAHVGTHGHLRGRTCTDGFGLRIRSLAGYE